MSNPSNKFNLLASSLEDGRLKLQENLKYHFASNPTATAEAFYLATYEWELTKALNTALDLEIPFWVLGSGTKTIIPVNVRGLLIQNKSSTLKISGIKGKVGKGGIGVEEAVVTAESGITLKQLNEFLDKQGLRQIEYIVSENSTIGGSIFIDPALQKLAEQVREWDNGSIIEVKVDKISRLNIVLSVTFRIKAKA